MCNLKVNYASGVKSTTELLWVSTKALNGHDFTNPVSYSNLILYFPFFRLLGHECEMCEDKPIFRNFLQMKKHMNMEHKHFYCDLCVDNLKVKLLLSICFQTWSILPQHQQVFNVFIFTYDEIYKYGPIGTEDFFCANLSIADRLPKTAIN